MYNTEPNISKSIELTSKNKPIVTWNDIIDFYKDLKYDSIHTFEKQAQFHITSIGKQLRYQTIPYQVNCKLPNLQDFPLSTFLKTSTAALKKQPFNCKGPIRRDCFAYFYLPIDCQYMQACNNLYCIMTHSTLEKMFHPLLYRTETCYKGNKCSRNKCSFRHDNNEDIEAGNLWYLWEEWWCGYRNWQKVLNQCILPNKEKLYDPEKRNNHIHTILSVRFRRLQPIHNKCFNELYQNLNHKQLNSPVNSLMNESNQFTLRLMLQPLNSLWMIPEFNKLFFDIHSKLAVKSMVYSQNFFDLHQNLYAYWQERNPIQHDIYGCNSPKTRLSTDLTSSASFHSRDFTASSRYSPLKDDSMYNSQMRNSFADIFSAIPHSHRHSRILKTENEIFAESISEITSHKYQPHFLDNFTKSMFD